MDERIVVPAVMSASTLHPEKTSSPLSTLLDEGARFGTRYPSYA